MKEIFVDKYEITPLTLAVLAHSDQYGNRLTCILEEKTKYFVENYPSKVMDDACQYFGASLRGRQEGTEHISGITHKAPIAIDPYSGMYFFPTISPSSPSCSWISHTHIKSFDSTKKDHTEIIFTTGQRIVVEVSKGSITNQINRTAQFRYLLSVRINPLKPRMYHSDQVAESSWPPFGPL